MFRNYFIQMIYNKFQKFVPQGEARHKFKKQCLKNKNILYENEQIQIGCKVTALYDFYSSENHLQINIFIGNKAQKPIDSFKTEYRGTSNLEVYLEEKNRSVKQKTQFKERLIVACNNYEEQILLLLDFQSNLLTLKSTPIPITLFSFCIFNTYDSMQQNLTNLKEISKLVEQKYEYTEESLISINQQHLKKGLLNFIHKYFNAIGTIVEEGCSGQFTLKNLIQEYTIIFRIENERNIKVVLSSNEYSHFDSIFSNLKFLLE